MTMSLAVVVWILYDHRVLRLPWFLWETISTPCTFRCWDIKYRHVFEFLKTFRHAESSSCHIYVHSILALEITSWSKVFPVNMTVGSSMEGWDIPTSSTSWGSTQATDSAAALRTTGSALREMLRMLIYWKCKTSSSSTILLVCIADC